LNLGQILIWSEQLFDYEAHAMSKRKLFGTDGIRGKANIYPMTCEIAMKLGRAVTFYFQSQKMARPLIVLGKDTRRSCYMLEQAFSAGVCSQGGEVILTGPLPTPGVAFVTRSMRAEAGVVISASHNVYHDNGIKIFDAQGHKLPDEVELELERMVLDQALVPVQIGPDLGSAKRLDEVIGRYIVQVKSVFDDKYDLEGMRIVVDCANGASYKVAPMIFSELGAEVFKIGTSPNGTNINDGCGSLHPEVCRGEIKKYRADLGICLDGDADRVVIIDGDGRVLDGDEIIGILAKQLLDQKVIKKDDEVVGTVMSNLGLERYIESLGLRFYRAQVGDRYVVERMRNSGAVLGGEPSGHILLTKYSTTGDGLIAALKVIECMKYYNRSLRELASVVKLYPQEMKNVMVKHKPPLGEVKEIQQAIVAAEQRLQDKGRLIVRYSGTESLLRVMVEGEDKKMVTEICNELVAVVTEALG